MRNSNLPQIGGYGGALLMRLQRGKRTIHRNEIKDFHLQVTACKNSTMRGEIKHVDSEQFRSFSSVLELVFLIEEKLEQIGAPKPAMEIRSWPGYHPAPKEAIQLSDHPVEEIGRSKVGGSEFMVRILFRQNATWQGEVHWLEADQKRHFRSFLELLVLLQEAMDESGRPEAEYVFNTWANEWDLDRRNIK